MTQRNCRVLRLSGFLAQSSCISISSATEKKFAHFHSCYAGEDYTQRCCTGQVNKIVQAKQNKISVPQKGLIPFSSPHILYPSETPNCLPFLPLIFKPTFLLCAGLHFTFKLHLREAPSGGERSRTSCVRETSPKGRGAYVLSPLPVPAQKEVLFALLSASYCAIRELIKNKWNQLSWGEKITLRAEMVPSPALCLLHCFPRLPAAPCSPPHHLQSRGIELPHQWHYPAKPVFPWPCSASAQQGSVLALCRAMSPVPVEDLAIFIFQWWCEMDSRKGVAYEVLSNWGFSQCY